jgi:fatty acid desaturase
MLCYSPQSLLFDPPMKTPRHSLVRYTADRYTVFHVFVFAAIQLVVWRFASPLVAALAVLPLLVLSLMSAPIHHNHQHVNVFRAPLLNRLFEIPLALQTGIGSYGWVLHHNLGHHLNYLSPDPANSTDESRWTRSDGETMGRVEYSARLFLTHEIDIFRVGQKHPRIYRKYLLMKVPLYVILAALFVWNPINTAILYAALPLFTLLHTCWVTYEHHSGLATDDHQLASRNRSNRIYNLLSQNLGYHTAHHLRPGLHWSALPAFHESIAHEIPKELVNPAFW